MNHKIILIFGLPGAGKTHFATRLKQKLGECAVHVNGDDIRNMYNDWDFSDEGRLRQAQRMRKFAEEIVADGKHAILDFVCPKQQYRDIIDADIDVYANRTPTRDFPDTTAMFEKPTAGASFSIFDDYDPFEDVVEEIGYIDATKPTALMIGRFQPWHDGHTALFEAALAKHGQVCIAIRTMPVGPNDPLDPPEVWDKIDAALSPKYFGLYDIVTVPNLVDVVYGRDVGWTVSKIDLPPEIEAIRATDIRAKTLKS